MKVRPSRLISDADGVIIDSRSHAYRNAHKIVSLFSHVESLESQADFERHFSREAQEKLVGESESETLRAMHRLLMRHTAPEHGIFENVLALYEQFSIPKIVVTSAYASGIAAVLGARQHLFVDILGRERGDKLSILESLYRGSEVYVTDSVRDIAKCKRIGIPVIAVGWGYGDEERLRASRPEFFVSNEVELSSALMAIGVE